MKKMWKRTLAVLLAVVLLGAAAPTRNLADVLSVTAAAESFSGTCDADLSWSLDTTVGTLFIVGTGEMKDYEAKDNDDGFRVNTPWYSCRSSIKTISLPDGLTNIGNYAFYGCTSLTGVTIPDSVTTIGSDTFSGCTSLAEVTIPDSVIEIGGDAFYGCRSLASVTIPDSMQYIPYGVFSGCTSLADVTIPNSVTAIGEFAFYDCTSLADVTIPNSVTTIGWYSFYGCTSLADVTIPNSVTTIGSSAFSGCTSLASVMIPNSVTTIDGNAFSRCTSLASVTIPNSVTKIGGYAFWGCTSLAAITVDPDNTAFSSDADGVLYNKDKTALIQYPIGNPRASFTVPDTVRRIEFAAFARCTNLTSVRLPEKLNAIGEGAFDSCTKLERVMLGNSLNEIGYFAFYDCTSLTRITIPSSVREIGGWAFWNVCNIIYSGEETASDDLEGFPWGARSVNGYVDGNFVYESADKKTLRACSSTVQGSVTVADSVTEIGERAFYGCSKLASVTIPDGVTSIGEDAFRCCTSLTGVKMPESIKDIGEWAFAECTSLANLTIPDGTESIGYSAFSGCEMLEYVHFPASVTTIFGTGEDWLFSGCAKLDHICCDTAECYARQYAAENGVEFVVCTGHPDPVPEPDPDPVIAIRNYTQDRTVDYRTTITFAVDPVQNPVEGAQVFWYIDGQSREKGETVTVSEAKKSFTVQAKYIKDGDVLAESATETVNVKTGFFARLKAFFRSLFKKLPVIAQEFLGAEYIDRILP